MFLKKPKLIVSLSIKYSKYCFVSQSIQLYVSHLFTYSEIIKQF